jgi:hypothetical protein
VVDVTDLRCGGEVLLRGVGCFAAVVVIQLWWRWGLCVEVHGAVMVWIG